MSLLDRLKAVVASLTAPARTARSNPESRWVVATSDDAISVTDAAGEVRRIARNDLDGLMIETNDSGPWGADVWWLLLSEDGTVACAFPQGATGEQQAVDWLKNLPGFDYAAMIEASASTSNGLFPLWKR